MAHIREVTRQSGKAYEVRWRDAGRDMQRTFKVRREAERFSARITTELADGLTTAQHRRVSHAVGEAWEAVAAQDRLRRKPTTTARYDQMWRTHVAPRWAKARVRDVTTLGIERWAGDLLKSGLSPATTLKAVQVLSKAMRYAVAQRWCSHNPALSVAIGAVQRPIDEHLALTPAQVSALAAELDEPWSLLVRFAAWSGVRAGELTALRLQDVNPLAGEVAVVRTMYREPGGWRADTPKSRNSTRTVALYDDALVADLRAYVAAHPLRHDPGALLWPGRAPGTGAPDYGRPFDHRVFVKRTFAPAVARAGLPSGLRWHDLRHTSASILLAAGLPVWVVSRNLGHADTATTTRIYGHTFDGRDHSAERAQIAAYVARQTRPVSSLPTQREESA